MLEAEGLTRRYGDFLAVSDVSFSIGQGEIVGLLGHNGAGKTTIMKMLTGYLEPSSGRVVVDGVNLAEDPKTVQARLGYLPENLPLYPEMSVADYLETRLWQPMGAEADGSWSLDSERSGFEKMESGINGRAIDFAKLG